MKEKIGACVPQTIRDKQYHPAGSLSKQHCMLPVESTEPQLRVEYFLFENRSPGGYDRGLYFKILYGSADSIYSNNDNLYTGG